MRILYLIGVWMFSILPQIGLANTSPQNISKLIRDFKSGEPIVNKSVLLEDVKFVEGKTNLDLSTRASLDEIALLIKKIPTVVVEVVSHTDKKSEKSMGRQLTRTRAKNISDYLILQGIPYQQILYTGLGDRESIASNKSGAGRATNNRVELRFVSLKKGKHEIITLDNQSIIGQTIIVDQERLYYRQRDDEGGKSLALKEVQRVDLAFGKSIIFNQPNPIMTEAVATTAPSTVSEKKQAKKVSNPISSSEKVKKTTPKKKVASPISNSKIAATGESVPSVEVETKKEKVSIRPELKSEVKTDFVYTKKEEAVATPITKTPIHPITPPTKEEEVVATVPDEVREQLNRKSPSTKIEQRQTTQEAEEVIIEEKKSIPSSTKRTVSTPPERILTEPKPSNTIDISTEGVVTLEEEDALNFYLDNYILQPKEKPKKRPTSEQFLQLNRGNGLVLGIDSRAGNSFTGSTSTVEGAIVQGELGGFTFQLIRQPLSAEAINIRFNYIDDSSEPSIVNINKTLPVNNTLLLSSLGFIYHSDSQLSYQTAITFGSNDNYKYNAFNIGAAYRIQKGKLTLLPGATLEYGSTKLFLKNHNLVTNIFTVNKRQFIGESVRIDYFESAVSISPQLGFSMPLKGKVDLLVNGGYNVGLSLGSKIKFRGTTENDTEKSVKKKLSIGNFSVDGERIEKRAQLVGLRGLMIKAGVIYNLY